MKIYVITVFNTFSNGTRYSEVASVGFKTLRSAQEALENLCMVNLPGSEVIYEDTHKSFNFSNGKFETMRSAIINEVVLND